MANDDVAARIEALENELAALKEHVAAQPDAETSRRDLFKKLAIAGAGAAVGSVAFGATRADATTGAALVLGQLQTAANIT